MSRLQGRHVVVMGAAGGLGPSAVSAAAAAGARLTLVGSNLDHLEPLRAAHADQVANTLAVDLTDPSAVDALAADLTAAGGVDVVWHLVGGWRGGTPLPDAPLADWDWLYQRLVATTVNVARAFAHPLAASAYGRFALVSSPQATTPTTTNAAYAATKAAAEATTLALADHFGSVGCAATANVVVVPAILTDAMRAAQPDRTWTNQVPTADLADTLVFLAGDAAAKMNGQRIRLHARSHS
jgi:3-oxoacyl-[acyl-carrier protein] reductase